MSDTKQGDPRKATMHMHTIRSKDATLLSLASSHTTICLTPEEIEQAVEIEQAAEKEKRA